MPSAIVLHCHESVISHIPYAMTETERGLDTHPSDEDKFTKASYATKRHRCFCSISFTLHVAKQENRGLCGYLTTATLIVEVETCDLAHMLSSAIK